MLILLLLNVNFSRNNYFLDIIIIMCCDQDNEKMFKILRELRRISVSVTLFHIELGFSNFNIECVLGKLERIILEEGTVKTPLFF